MANPDDVRRAESGPKALIGADLSQADLTAAKYDDHTEWPNGFDPEKVGAIKTDRKWLVEQLMRK